MTCHYFNLDQNDLLEEAKERLDRNKNKKAPTDFGAHVLRMSREADEGLVAEKESKKAKAAASPRVINFLSYEEEALLEEAYGKRPVGVLLNKKVYALTLTELEYIYDAIIKRLDSSEYRDEGDTPSFKVAYNLFSLRAKTLGLPLRKV